MYCSVILVLCFIERHSIIYLSTAIFLISCFNKLLSSTAISTLLLQKYVYLSLRCVSSLEDVAPVFPIPSDQTIALFVSRATKTHYTRRFYLLVPCHSSRDAAPQAFT